MFKKFIFSFFLFLIASGSSLQGDLEDQFKQIDDEFSGNIGVYVKDLGNGTTINYNSDRDWYLASTIKIPLAIAVLQKVEDGELSLDDELTLSESDFVDGAGDMLWMEPGKTFTIRELIKRSIRDSDSTATDMLIRLLGEEELNEQINNRIVEGLGFITTILQVRYEAFGQLHQNAENLSNMDIIELRGITLMEDQLDELLRRIQVQESEINVSSIPEAFERYYETDLNSGKLQSMGDMLERLAEGEYLNEDHTELLLDNMKKITTGDNRIIAGLPAGTEFANKTGTQIGRACNMGIVYPQNKEEPIIVAACAEKYERLNDAESVFKEIGHSLSETWMQ